MSERLVHAQITELSEVLVQLSNKVLENFLLSLHAVVQHDEHGTVQRKLADYEIDMAEIDLEERCLSFLALQHPVASDLRTIMTIIMINDELERIGDLSLHSLDLMLEITPGIVESFEFEKMGVLAAEMVKKSITAFTLKEQVLADQISDLDKEIKVMHRSAINKATALIKIPDADVSQLMAVLSISRYIEHIADHAVKILREVIYLVTGEIIHKDALH
jgi:phosphate transport system protein